jgi:hypothetical protein
MFREYLLLDLVPFCVERQPMIEQEILLATSLHFANGSLAKPGSLIFPPIALVFEKWRTLQHQPKSTFECKTCHTLAVLCSFDKQNFCEKFSRFLVQTIFTVHSISFVEL